MLFSYDLTQMVHCTRFGRMVQRNHWNRQGVSQKNVNLLVYIIAGEAVFTFDGEQYSVKAGDALLIPAETAYRADTADSCDYYFFHFTGMMERVKEPQGYPQIKKDFSFDLADVSHSKITIMQRTQTGDVDAKLYGLMTDCEELHNSATFSGRLAIDNVLCRILLILAQFTEQQYYTTGYPMVLDKMLTYIHKNLTAPITTAQLCQYCGVSESYAARIFKKHLNTTMTQYITDQKLSYACELIRNTGMNISQIASYLGFCDVYYFSRRFKEKYGKAPTQMFVRKQ